MGKRYVAKEAQCPFYHSEDHAKIYCEGVDGKTSIHLAFGSVTELKGYRNRFCCRDYKSCHIAKMHYKRYEVDKP